MSKKMTQIDFDLQEIECALRSAAAGGPVIYKSAEEALQRLVDTRSVALPKGYKVKILRESRSR